MFIQGKVTCCYKCEERTVGCHGTCERYLNQVKEHQEESERIRKAKAENRQLESYADVFAIWACESRKKTPRHGERTVRSGWFHFLGRDGSEG